MTRHRMLALLLAVLAVGAGGGLAVRTAGVHPVKIVSDSMAPTVKPGEWIVVKDLDALQRSTVRRGDVVMFRFPLGTTPAQPAGGGPPRPPGPQISRAIKRVLAVSGDRVTITAHSVTVNGHTTQIAGAPGPTSARRHTETVPPGRAFLLGDNTKFSIDSRAFGAIDVQQIVATDRFTAGTTRRMMLAALAIAGLLALAAAGVLRLRRQG